MSQTSVAHVRRHADDFEFALVVQESNAPAQRIRVPEVSPRQPLGDDNDRRGARLVAFVDLPPGQEGNLHGGEKMRSGAHDARVRHGHGADPDCASVYPSGTAGADEGRLRKRRVVHTGDRFEAFAKILVECSDFRGPMAGLARVQAKQQDVLAGVSQLDGVQFVECPDKETRGDQEQKRDRDLGTHQNLLRAVARSAAAAVFEGGHDVGAGRLDRGPHRRWPTLRGLRRPWALR